MALPFLRRRSFEFALNPAIHAAEVTFVFRTLSKGRVLGSFLVGGSTPRREDVAREFQEVWAGFAKDPKNGPTNMGWPVYDPNGMFYPNFGNNDRISCSA
jgi:carboxylesterase type B